MQLPNIVLIANLLSTFYMVGLIWMVQIVHYPLFAKVAKDEFVSYQLSHQTLITPVVGLPMLIELLGAILLIWFRPRAIPDGLVYVALALVILMWASTAFIQIPCHETLTQGFDATVHSRLVNSNWIRTLGWTVRGGLVTWMLILVLNWTQLAHSGKAL